MRDVCFVGHRRHVHSGTVCKGAAGSSCGGAESAGSGTGVRAGPQDGAEDAGVCGAARVSTTAAGPAAEAGSVAGAIDAILEEDKSRPRRQRHTAKRIFERLREEHGYTGGYTIVKDYVRQSKLGAREMFVPLSHAPGEAQADFGEALVVIAGVECEAHYLAFDLPHSDDCFVVAFPAETTEAFLEGHVRAFAYFGGVPTRILYDNTTLAVARILGDGERQKTRAFSELQSHYLFAEKFGRPAKGNDKGKVEGLVGYARRNFMVPIPRATSWEELNAHLEAGCLKRRQRRLRGHSETIAERFERDRAALLPLPAAPYEACEKITTRVTSLSLVRYRSNDYSVPTEYGHRQVLVKGYVHQVVIVCGSEVIARHERSYERESAIFDPLHYLRLLEHKSRALEQAAPLVGWQLPDCFLHLRQAAGSAPEEARTPRVYPGAAVAGDLRARRSIRCHRRCPAHEHHQLRCRAPHHALPYRTRPPRLDLQNWPHLPLPRVRTTAAADYMTLLAGISTSPAPSDMEVG